MRPTLYAFAGGDPALLALAAAHHARCLADPELNHPFSHGDLDPDHIARLAAYWGEVFGGPPRFSAFSGQRDLLALHAGNGDMTDLSRRFVHCFVVAADDAGLPTDPEFRATIRRYMEWAVGTMNAHPDGPDDIPADVPVPRWGWDGLILT